MSADPFHVPQFEHGAEAVAGNAYHLTVKDLNMRAALTGDAYPVSGDMLAFVKRGRP